jgi:hypothetical protein
VASIGTTPGAAANVAVRYRFTAVIERGALMTEDAVEVRVGQLWRRRLDGRRFIPATRVADGWLDRSGVKRTAAELHEKYVLVRVDERNGDTH